MKIVVFNNAKEVLDIYENLENAEVISSKEARWHLGGAVFEENFIILNDDQSFEDLTDEDILTAQKHQINIDLARDYEERRISALAEGTEEEERAAFEETRGKVLAAADREEIIHIKNTHRAARAEARAKDRAARSEAGAPRNQTL